jgi:DMSO/TMAO reductase YedYZ molybdopterin-dependent catalytic subunit
VGSHQPAHGERHLPAFLAEPPPPAEFGGFADYHLRISGLVEHPQEISFADLKAMPKQCQITTHFCIQGWSGVAKWSGVPMRHILELVRPMKEARYAVFYSMENGATMAGATMR